MIDNGITEEELSYDECMYCYDHEGDDQIDNRFWVSLTEEGEFFVSPINTQNVEEKQALQRCPLMVIKGTSAEVARARGFMKIEIDNVKAKRIYNDLVSGD